MTNCCCNKLVIPQEEIAAIYSAIASCIGTAEFKITSIVSQNGERYETTEVVLN